MKSLLALEPTKSTKSLLKKSLDTAIGRDNTLQFVTNGN